MKWIDLPPVWLLACLGVAYAWRWPAGWQGWPVAGWTVVIGSLALIALAAASFRRARTTIVPREAPSALIGDGVYRMTRNPIYLADMLLLFGFSLVWGSVPGLLLVPLLGWILTSRFILGEEARLAEAFGPEYEAYRNRVRRWI